MGQSHSSSATPDTVRDNAREPTSLPARLLKRRRRVSSTGSSSGALWRNARKQSTITESATTVTPTSDVGASHRLPVIDQPSDKTSASAKTSDSHSQQELPSPIALPTPSLAPTTALDDPETAVSSRSPLATTIITPETNTIAPVRERSDPLAEERQRALDIINAVLPIQTEEPSPSLPTERASADNPAVPDVTQTAETTSTTPTHSPTVPNRRIVVQGTISTAPPRQSPSTTSNEQDTSTSPSSGSFLDSLLSAATPSTSRTESSDPPTDPIPSSSSPPEASAESPLSPVAQAAIISRLLSVAAASTAASLLPGQITIDGQVVEPFPGLEASALVSGEVPTGTLVGVPLVEEEQAPRRETWLENALRRTVSSDGSHVRLPHLPRRTTAPVNGTQGSSWDSRPGRTRGDEGGAVVVSRPNLHNSPMPRDDAPEESFERFLSDLQADLGVAILRHQRVDEIYQSTLTTVSTTEEAAGGAPVPSPVTVTEPPTESPIAAVTEPPTDSSTTRTESASRQTLPFAFFRSFRFAPRMYDVNTGQIADETVLPTIPERIETWLDPAMSTMDVFEESSSPPSQGDGSSTDALPEADTNTPAQPVPTNRVSVTPFLVVGVRAMHPNDRSLESRLRDGPDQSVNSAGAEDTASDIQPILPEGSDHSEATTLSNVGNQYLLFLTGGIFPADTPTMHLPFLFNRDSAPTYEDFLRLAELLGNAKNPTVTSEEIERANLRIVDGGEELKEMEKSGDVMSSTAERCLICLSDYEEGEQVRVLSCKHCYHKACVDRWLETSKNNCPFCRTEAISKDTPPEAAATTESQQESTPTAQPPLSAI